MKSILKNKYMDKDSIDAIVDEIFGEINIAEAIRRAIRQAYIRGGHDAIIQQKINYEK